jgi:hypothetical protein
LDVKYDVPTQHWLLRHAYYSQHAGYAHYAPYFGKAYASVVYPERLGGYPRAYVAGYKHANYASLSACDEGGWNGADWCSPDTHSRVAVSANANLGSRAHHTPLQDCMPSTNPLYSDGGLECYWTEQRFKGWQAAIPDAGPYSTKLADFGF